MRIDRSRIFVEVTGSGLPILFIHGCPGTHTVWRPVVERLASERLCVTVDLPGFGNSVAVSVKEMAPNVLAGKLVELMRELGHDKFDLVGHSYGGAIAATLAAEYGGVLRSLVLITPLTQRLPFPARVARSLIGLLVVSPIWRIVPDALREIWSKRGVRFNYSTAYTEKRALEIAEELNRDDAMRSAHIAMTSIDCSALDRSYTILASDPHFPILLIGADRDKVIPYRHFEALVGRLKTARRFVFPAGSHVPMWQFPDEITALLREFLA